MKADRTGAARAGGAGQPASADPADVPAAERRQRAAAALADAVADARARGDWPSAARSGPLEQDRSGGSAFSNEKGLEAGGVGSGRRTRRDDPQTLGTAMAGLLSDHGWKEQVAVGSVFSNWQEIVGSDLAAHTRPDGFAEGELVIAADSTAWATQVRLLASMLVRRLNAELGEGTVKRVKVRGPAGPRQRGGWRVPGSRGHGDTYG
ncbi:MAG TPA: DciA family protein [Streptosporangiaceae bacterium]|nr:DciA family protein [Streptosporangiaceae bacterium]